jgi:hypothetical protein
VSKPRTGQKIPRLGSYTGSVNGHNALLIVSEKAVEAIWHVSPCSDLVQFYQVANAWDVTDGAFLPIHHGDLATVLFNANSRK